MVTEYLSKKQFENLFLPFQTDKEISVLKRLNKIPKLLADTSVRLASLEFIKHIRISETEIIASNETKGTRIKLPITSTNHPTATGISLVYHFDYNVLDFDEINSPTKGNGQRIVDCILKDFPKNWQAGIFMDWSGGFWDKIKQKHKDINWIDY
jgi:hypothetical protein